MAEVFGTIAAVVGVAQAGTELSVYLYKIGRAATCPEKLKKLLESVQPEVSLMSSVSDQLATTLRDVVAVRVCKFDTFETTRQLAVESLATLNDAKDILKKTFESENIGFIDRLKMHSVEKRIDLIRSNIDRLRATLILILESVNLARNVMIDQKNPTKQESEIILALKEENREKTKKYQKLVGSITIDGGTIAQQLSKLDISIFNSGPNESETGQYTVVEIDGSQIAKTPPSDVLAWKLENISQLITEIEQTQKDFAKVAKSPEHAGIWEAVEQNGGRHFRHTAITIHSHRPEVDGTRSITPDSYPMPQFHKPRQELKIIDIYIALMGAVGTGKSTFVNVCCSETLATTSHAPGRCTETIEEYHFMYTQEIRIHLIDTPGFDHAHRSEREILTDLLEWTKISPGGGGEQKPKLLSGILYFHKISDAKPQLSTHRNLRLLEKLCIHTDPPISTSSSPPPSTNSTFDPTFDPTLDTTFYPPSTTSTTSSAYTATSYYASSTTSSNFTTATTATTTSTSISLHPIILVTTNWEYFLGDDDRALQHESDLRTHDDYWGAMIRRGSCVVRYASADRDSAMGVLRMLSALEKISSDAFSSVSGGISAGIPGSTIIPGATTTGGAGAGDMRYFHGDSVYGRDDMGFGLGVGVEEPGEYERGRALSLSDTPASVDAQVGELLAEFTNVVMNGPMVPVQHRRWTTDQTY